MNSFCIKIVQVSKHLVLGNLICSLEINSLKINSHEINSPRDQFTQNQLKFSQDRFLVAIEFSDVKLTKYVLTCKVSSYIVCTDLDSSLAHFLMFPTSLSF